MSIIWEMCELPLCSCSFSVIASSLCWQDNRSPHTRVPIHSWPYAGIMEHTSSRHVSFSPWSMSSYEIRQHSVNWMNVCVYRVSSYQQKWTFGISSLGKWYFTLRESSLIFLELFLLPTICTGNNSAVTIFWILDDNHYSFQWTDNVTARTREKESGRRRRGR